MQALTAARGAQPHQVHAGVDRAAADVVLDMVEGAQAIQSGISSMGLAMTSLAAIPTQSTSRPSSGHQSPSRSSLSHGVAWPRCPFSAFGPFTFQSSALKPICLV